MQIKLTGGSKGIGLNGPSDYLLVLQLVNRRDFVEVYSGPGAIVWAAAPEGSGRQRPVGLAKLRELSQLVAPVDRIVRISGRAIGTSVVAEIADTLVDNYEEDVAPNKSEITPEASAWVAYASKLRQTALAVCTTESIEAVENTASHPKVLGLLLLSRTLGHLKSILLLLSERRVVDARILVRCSLENLFWVAALMADGPRFEKAMIDDDMRHRRMRGENLLRVGLESEAEEMLRQFLRDTKQFADAKTLSPKGVAHGTDVSQAYLFYSDLSADSGHPSITSLNRHYIIEPDNARVIDVEPDAEDREIAETMHLICYALLTTVMVVDNLLGSTGVGPEIQLRATEYMTLLKTIGATRQA